MKFGELYSFLYRAKNKRKFDPKPVIIFLKETKEKVFGLNLNFVPPRAQNAIIKTFNHEIFKNFQYDPFLTKMAQEREQKLSEQQMAQYLFYGNIKNRSKISLVLSEQKVRSERMIFTYMQNAFRIYLKTNIESIPTPVLL